MLSDIATDIKVKAQEIEELAIKVNQDIEMVEVTKKYFVKKIIDLRLIEHMRNGTRVVMNYNQSYEGSGKEAQELMKKNIERVVDIYVDLARDEIWRSGFDRGRGSYLGTQKSEN